MTAKRLCSITALLLVLAAVSRPAAQARPGGAVINQFAFQRLRTAPPLTLAAKKQAKATLHSILASFRSNHDKAAALQALIGLQKRYPAYGPAYYDAGIMSESSRKIPEAISDFRQFLRLSPNSRHVPSAKQHLTELCFLAHYSLAKMQKKSQGMEVAARADLLRGQWQTAFSQAHLGLSIAPKLYAWRFNMLAAASLLYGRAHGAKVNDNNVEVDGRDYSVLYYTTAASVTAPPSAAPQIQRIANDLNAITSPPSSRWLVVYNGGRYTGVGIPPGLAKVLDDCYQRHVAINSVQWVSNTMYALFAGSQWWVWGGPQNFIDDLNKQTPNGLNFGAMQPNGGWIVVHNGKDYEANGLNPNMLARINYVQNNASTIKTIAFTPGGSMVLLYDKNSFTASGDLPLPPGFSERVRQLQRDGHTLNTTAFGPNDSWVVVYDDNSATWQNIPQKLTDCINAIHTINGSIQAIAISN